MSRMPGNRARSVLRGPGRSNAPGLPDRDAKLGYALRHLPSGIQAVNRVWLWAALLALNLSAWTQALGLGTSSHAHAKRLRRELVCVPGRVIRHARATVLRLPPHAHHLAGAYARLRALPDPPG